MNQKRLAKIILIVLVVALVAVAGYFVLVKKQEPNNASQSLVSSLFDTRITWAITSSARGQGMLLIRDGIDGKNLLLTLRDRYEKDSNKYWAVYLYDPSAQSLQQVPNEQWDTATSPITDLESFSQSHRVGEKFTVNGEKLFFDNQEIPYKGKLIMGTYYFSNANQLAVFSADGPLRSVTPNFLAGGGKYAKGQHYHQLFSAMNGTPIGDAVKLPFITNIDQYSVYWSPDGKYIFYIALTRGNLTIVKTSLLSK